jgi:small subunit ribosomal protein S18
MSTLKRRAKEKRKRRNRFKKFLERKTNTFTGREHEIDYKNIELIQKLVTPQGKLFSRKRVGASAKHQQMIKRAVKRARFMALLPYRN